MRWSCVVLLVGCSTAQPRPVPLVVEVRQVDAAPNEVPTPVALPDVRVLFGPNAVDLAAFLPGTQALVVTIDGEPHYAFQRGDDVFPLTAQRGLRQAGACLPLLQPVAIWSFGDGVAYAPAEGRLLVPDRLAPFPCWRGAWLDSLSAFVSTTAVKAEAKNKRSLSVKSKTRPPHTAMLDMLGDPSVRLDSKDVVPPIEAASYLPWSDLDIWLGVGAFVGSSDPITAISASAEHVVSAFAIDWQGAPGTTRLAQWKVSGHVDSDQHFATYVEANRLPLESGAVIDTLATRRNNTYDEHIGMRLDAALEARANLSFGGKTLALWPPFRTDPVQVMREDLVPFDVTNGACRVSVGDPRIPGKVMVRCGTTEHALAGPPTLIEDGDETMKVIVDDHGAFLVLEVEHAGQGAGSLHRRWLVPKQGGVALETFVDDLVQ